MSQMNQINPLTPRQKEILTLAALGWTNKEIARRLNISSKTVEKHLARIFQVLDISNRTAAVSIAIQHGWIQVPFSSQSGLPGRENPH